MESKADDGEFYFVDNNNTVMKVSEKLILSQRVSTGEVLQVSTYSNRNKAVQSTTINTLHLKYDDAYPIRVCVTYL